MDNKNEKKKSKSAILIGAIVFVFAGALVGGVYALQGSMYSPSHWFSGDNATATALKNGDYQGYLNAIDANWQTYRASITQDKFNEMSQQYNNRTAQISTMQANKKAVDQAIQDGNYQEWVTAINALGKKPAFADKITADNFAIYVQMYKAEQNKDWTTAQQDAQQLGITAGMHPGAGMGFGFGGHRRFMHSNAAAAPASS